MTLLRFLLACVSRSFWSRNPAYVTRILLGMAFIFAQFYVQDAHARAYQVLIQTPEEVYALLANNLLLAKLPDHENVSDFEVESLLRDSTKEIQDLLATEGFFKPQIAIDHNPLTRRIVLDVTPGAAAIINTIEVGFVGDIKDGAQYQRQREDVIAALNFIKNKKFRQQEWDGAKTSALVVIRSMNFPYATIQSSQALVNREKAEVQLKLVFDSQLQVYFEEPTVVGLSRYDALRVTNNSVIFGGSPYDVSAIVRTRSYLNASGYFTNVFINEQISQTPSSLMPVVIRVEEAPMQQIETGLGVSSNFGARLTLDYRHNRVPKTNWLAKTQVRIDKQEVYGIVDLHDPPSVKGWRWFVSQSAGLNKINNLTIRSTSTTWGVSSDEERIQRLYSISYDTGRVQGNAVDTASTIVMFNYLWHWRAVDSIIDPQIGQTIRVELNYGRTGQNQDVLRSVLRGWKVFNLGDTRLVLSATWGEIKKNETTEIPSHLKFYAGGENSIRGYAYQSIGIIENDKVVAGGERILLKSISLLRALAPNWDYTVFYDEGQVGVGASLGRIYAGYGIGARWRSPLGPLEIDLAYGQQTGKLRLHLNLGFVF